MDERARILATAEELKERYSAIQRQEERDREELKRRVHRAFTPEQRAVVADLLQLLFESRPINWHSVGQTIAMFRE